MRWKSIIRVNLRSEDNDTSIYIEMCLEITPFQALCHPSIV